MKTLAVIGTQPIIQNDDLSITYTGQANVDGDGSPRCYGPVDSEALDYLANAGHPGNWFGIATDAQGEPIVQQEGDPYPGMYVSTTSLQRHGYGVAELRRYVDSETVPYIVIPGIVAKNCEGVVLGCQATVADTRTGKVVQAVVADTGPNTNIGEISIKTATELGFDNVSPKNGGVQENVFQYRIFPNQAYPGFTPMSITGEFHPELASATPEEAVPCTPQPPESGLQVNYDFQT